MKFGFSTICQYSDGFREPEGIVIFDECPPKPGTTIELSDGKLWRVTKFDELYQEVIVENIP